MQPQKSNLALQGSPCYRQSEQRRIVAGLLSGNSLLVVGEPGSGKSSLAHFIAQAEGVTERVEWSQDKGLQGGDKKG